MDLGISSLVGILADYWVLSTYFSVIIFNESAILASFLIVGVENAEKYIYVGLISILGVITNDIILYGMARYGLGKFSKGKYTDRAPEIKTVFQKFFLRNIFFSLLFLKFLFGFRTMLTLYIIVRRKVPFFLYLLCDLLGIILYVFVLGVVGWLVGIGFKNVYTTYSTVTNGVAIFFLIFLVLYSVFLVWGGVKKRIIGKPEKILSTQDFE